MGLDGSSVFKLIPSCFTLESLDQLFADYPRQDFNVRLWDGTSWGSKEHPRFAFILKNPSALWQLMRSPSELTLGEAFIFDDLDIEGDLEAAFDVGDFLISAGERNLSSTPFLAKLLTFPDRHHGNGSGAHPQGEVHSRDRDRQAIQYHYDLPAEFYSLWLDEAMIYSSAYFENPDESLDSAQFHKMDYICRKLQLKPGEKLLDVGCGWGGLLVHAAKHYAVDAVGISSVFVRRKSRGNAFANQDCTSIVAWRSLIIAILRWTARSTKSSASECSNTLGKIIWTSISLAYGVC